MQRSAPLETAGKSAPVLALFRRLSRWPGGQALFSRLVCMKAPYFASISPRVTVLRPGRCEARMAQRRRVQNHIGTVHAIALCNLAELGAGLVTDASIPADMRWIPKGMEVQYLRKALGQMHAVAVPAFEPGSAAEGYELPVLVEVSDGKGETVFSARVRMWVSPKRSG